MFSPITATIVFSPNKIGIVHNIIKYLNCIFTKCFLIFGVGSINFNQIKAKDEDNILFLAMYNQFLCIQKILRRKPPLANQYI